MLASPSGLRTCTTTLGDPDEVGEQLSDALASGVDGFTCSLPANGHIPGRVELLGQVAGAVVG